MRGIFSIQFEDKLFGLIRCRLHLGSHICRMINSSFKYDNETTTERKAMSEAPLLRHALTEVPRDPANRGSFHVCGSTPLLMHEDFDCRKTIVVFDIIRF